ncbi:MAG: leucyl aminopeptidase [Buchnera aphidicola (Nurudea yanoniella)]
MKYNINCIKINKNNSNCLIFGIFEDLKVFGSLKYLNKTSNGYIDKVIQNQEMRGRSEQFLCLYDIPNIISKRIILIGCGKKELFDINQYKKILKTSLKIVQKMSIINIDYFISEFDIEKVNIYWKIRHSISLIQEFTYHFKKFKSKKLDFYSVLDSIYFNTRLQDDILPGKIAIKHGLAISKGIKYSKDLSNTPPNICNPSYLAFKSKQLSSKYPNIMSASIINHNDMKNLKMNAYLSVGAGSKNKPIMSVIKYKGNKSCSSKNIVFIGKGVTFDSGGISLKPSNNMDEMKYDMSGAAVVFGLMVFISELKLPINVIGILAGCENMPSGASFRPGDILTTMSGKTVEVLNTDAEGRLIICDVLTYVKKFNPDIVIDIATLTGACIVALGNDVTGLMSNDTELAEDINTASIQTDDKVWILPLFKEYYRSLESNIADMNNTGGKYAGAITAACFLSKFSKKYKWAHLDIAGTAWTSGKRKFSTGRPMSLLAQFILNKLENK